MDIDIISGLYYYDLTIIKYNNNYRIVDLITNEWYEEMSIYYIRGLLSSWIRYRNSSYNML